MATSNVNVLLATNAQQFKTEMAVAGAAVYGFGRQVFQTVGQVEQTSRRIGATLIGFGTAFVGAATVATKVAADLETSLNNVATVWDEAGQEAAGTLVSLKDAGDQLLDLSTQLPQSAVTLADGLYDVASSGFQGTEALQVLEGAAQAASAGLTDTGTAARAITASINAYGLAAEDVNTVSDTLFQTVNLGVLTFEQLAQNMGDFIPGAAALGVPLEAAGSALATITLNGFNASQAATALTGVFRKLAAPTEAMSELLDEAGFNSGQAALQQIGLAGVMDLVRVKTGGNASMLRELFEEQEAVNGATSLMAQSGELYNRVITDMGDETSRTGATQEALAKQAQSLSFQMDILRNTVVAIVTEFGQAFLPIVKPIIGLLQLMLEAFRDIPDPIKTLITGIGVLGTGLTVLAGIWLINKIQMELFGIALKRLGVQAYATSKALTVLKVGLGVAGIALAGAGLAALIFGGNTSDAAEDTEAFQGRVEELKASLDETTGSITNNTKEMVAQRLVEQGLDQDAKALGLSMRTVVDAYLGGEKALEQVRAATEAYNEAIGAEESDTVALMMRLDEQKDSVEDMVLPQTRLTAVIEGGNRVTKEATELAERQARALGAVASEAGPTAEAMKRVEEVNKAILSVAEDNFGVVAVMRRVLDAQGDAESGYTDKLRDELRDRHDAQRDALDDRHELEREGFEESRELLVDALEAQQEAERKVLEKTQEAERKSLEERNDAEMKAIDARHRARERAHDEEARQLRNALDDQQQIAQDAFDRQMEDLRDSFDGRIEEEKEAWEQRKHEILNNIEDTFGAERQHWQQVLETEEDAHEDRVDAIEEEGDDAVRAQENAFERQLRAQDQALDDRLQNMVDGLEAIKQAEVDAWEGQYEALTAALDEQHEAQATALAARHEAAADALNDETEQLQRALDDRFEREGRALERRQEQENSAADRRLESQKGKQDLSLASLQSHLDAAEEEYHKFNRNLAIIASRGGADVIGEIAKLGPEIVAQAAAAGPQALDNLLESIRIRLSGYQDYGRYRDIGINPYATMAEGHVATIAMSGPRLWAEPETGGEAYIPLARSKRARSTSILAQTAGYFGYGLIPMANGGWVGGGGAGGGGMTVSMPIHVEARVEAGIDMGRAGAIIARQVENGVRVALSEVERQVRVKAWRN